MPHSDSKSTRGASRSTASIRRKSASVKPNRPATRLEGTCSMAVFQVPDHSVVIAAGILKDLLDLTESPLQL